jgi:tetratricopeptide (TPR) repeat protein
VSGVKQLYDHREVTRISGISEHQMRYWDKIGLVSAVKKEKGRLLYDFKALIALRTIRGLLDRGVSIRTIRRSIPKLKQLLPQIENPLTELRIDIQGKRIIICRNDTEFTPEGQLQIRFKDVRTAKAPTNVGSFEDSFFKALASEEEGDFSEALAQYAALLEVQPDHPDVLVNVGNIKRCRGNPAAAEQFYRRALRVDSDHVEANYNLANILEDRGEVENAILFYIKTVYEDPEFADAHFNLARILEKAGEKATAKKHWRIYLELNPDSQWADFIRERLEQ